MKKLLSIAVAAISVSAIAAYTPVSVGVTKITTTNTDTIIPVPFKALADGQDIPVAQLVNPDGLIDGTTLYVYDGSGYSAWVLGSGVWTGATKVTKDGSNAAAGGESAKLVAGGAIWIVLPATPSPSQDIYVYGAYSSAVTTSTAAVNASTLVANPLQTNATISVTGVYKGDVILVPTGDSTDPDRYVCTTAGETPVWKKNRVAGLPTFAMGQGFWYVSTTNTTAGARTITWTAAQ